MAKRKVEIEFRAQGYLTVEVEEEDLKGLLNEEGTDFKEEVLDESVDIPFQHFGLGPCAPIDAAIDGEEMLNALDVEVAGLELKKEK